ncbi:kinesin-domain-containing protein, partial [Saccharata proteae CBS 121410]
RPTMNPPSTPLPSLPVPKTRKAASLKSPSSPERRASTTSTRSLQSTNPASRPASSGLPLRPQPAKFQNNSASAVPTLPLKPSAPSIPTPGKTLRKTISIGAFPQPPKGVANRGSHPPSPLSTETAPDGTTTGRRGSAGSIPSGAQTMRKKTTSVPARGQFASKSPLTSPSLLNGSGENKSVHVGGAESRSVSPPGSNATSFEDIGENDGPGQVDGSAADRNSTHKDGKGNVVVSVRVRPDAASNDGKNEPEWVVDGRRSLIEFRGREGGEYQCDNVFTAHDNNARVYDSAAKRLVRRVMEGYHGTVFAYGMTGTGKTFSMQGTATSPGVIPLAITDIFSFIRETPHREFLLRVSYLEIYNEKINDLLSAPAGPGVGPAAPQEEIKLREDSKRGVYATPLKEEIVQSPTQLLRVIARGDNARRVAGTQFNARSSRSHAVVQIVVESRERVPGGNSLQESKRAAIAPGGVRVSTLSLIDLAGSEKAAEDKERRTEGAHINKSLLTLGTVIARLSDTKDKSGNPADKDGKHLPYRDSKLTRLLQPALSGNSLVSILCTVQIGSAGSSAKANTHVTETLNTLKFASRAKNNIVSHAKKADEANGSGGDAGSRALLDRYRLEIQELRKQLETKKEEEAREREQEEEKAREVENENRHEEQMLEMQLARTALKERIEHLNRLILSSKSIGVNSGRSFSSMSMGLQQRGSMVSNGEPHPASVRSSMASQMTLEVPNMNRTSSVGLGSEEEDSLGENGDGTASSTAQIRSLQADLADKNRYISTLERRLLQARRSSHSRVSMTLARQGEEGGVEALLKEKDDEIAELRARLDDKDRMVTALRSAARKRDMADLTLDTTLPTSPNGRRIGSSASSYKNSAISPVSLLGPKSEKRSKDVEDITRMLDDMISERVD